MAKKLSSDEGKRENRYGGILADIFAKHYRPGMTSLEFERGEIAASATKLGIVLPKNVGDLLYSFRFRTALPVSISNKAKEGFEWVIELAGRAKYRMIQRKDSRIVPNPNLIRIKIPDSTPEIVAVYTQSDEQAALAKVRYNRLIDLFLRVSAYSLQNHLRTTVPDMGQIETDEIYVAVNNHGQQFVIPVQAKGGNDQIGVVQVMQDLALCRNAFSNLTPRPVAVYILREEGVETIVMFELTEVDGEVKILDEKHYQLVPANSISSEEIARYKSNSK